MGIVFLSFLQNLKKKKYIIALLSSPIIGLLLRIIVYLLRGVFEEWLFSNMLNLGATQMVVQYIYANPWILILIPIPIAIIVVLIWMYIDFRQERTLAVDKAPLLLYQLYERTSELKNEAIKKGIDQSKLEDACKLIADRLGMIKSDDYDDFLAKASKSISRKKKGKTNQQLAAMARKMIPIPQHGVGKLEDLEIAGRALDGEKIGLARFTQNDKLWKRQYKELQRTRQIMVYANDKELGKLIDEYTFKTYYWNSFSLWLEYIDKYIPDFYMPASFKQSGAPYIQMDMDKEMNETMLEIQSRIVELKNSSNTSRQIEKKLLIIEVLGHRFLETFPPLPYSLLGEQKILAVNVNFSPKEDLRLHSIELRVDGSIYNATSLPVVIIDREEVHSIEFAVPVRWFRACERKAYVWVLAGNRDYRSNEFKVVAPNKLNPN